MRHMGRAKRKKMVGVRLDKLKDADKIKKQISFLEGQVKELDVQYEMVGPFGEGATHMKVTNHLLDQIKKLKEKLEEMQKK